MKRTPNSTLQRELFILALLGILALVLLFLALAAAADDAMLAIVGLLQSLPLWLALWAVAWLQQAQNRAAASAAPFPSLGAANALTLWRGVLIAATAGFLLQPLPQGYITWVPALCYSLAAILDRIDGWLARNSGRVSLLGSSLDINYDAVGLVVAPLLALQYHKIPASYLCVSAAYFLFCAGLWWRRTRQLPLAPLRASALRRTFAGTQMGFIAFALWPPLQDILTRITAIAFMLPLLAGFWIDWLVVSTRLPATAAVERGFARSAKFTDTYLLPALRGALLVALWLGLQSLYDQLSPLVITLLILASGGILLGIAGRVCALALLLTLNFTSGYDFITTLALLVQFFSVWVLVFGTGRFSLWLGDEVWIQRQDGAAKASEP